MHILRRRARFSAAHRLPHVPPGHPCGRLHGHTWEIEVELRTATLPSDGWVMDFAEVDAALAPALDQLDHRVLNDVPGLDNPTSERLAVWLAEALADALPGIAAVRVREGRDSEVEYRLRQSI